MRTEFTTAQRHYRDQEAHSDSCWCSAALFPTPLPEDGVREACPSRAHYELYADTPLLYRSGYRAGVCRLRLFRPVRTASTAQVPAVALVTEQPTNEGLSITNGIEIIAGAICQRYGLNPQHTVLIEHYDDREQGCAARLPGRIDGEKFSCIVFEKMEADETRVQKKRALNDDRQAVRLQRPQWRPMGKADVELLIGQRLS